MAEFSSVDYWESRYASGGNSGAGSYGRLAAFKAEFVNSFVKMNDVSGVIELGCGDGNQLSLLSLPQYVGLDVSTTSVRKCREKFNELTHRFMSYDELSDLSMAELCLSMDVIFHLVEDEVFEQYVRNLFCFSTKYVIIYASDYDAAWPDRHVRHRCVSAHIRQFFPEWALVARIPNLYPFDARYPELTSFCEFMIFSRTRERCWFSVPGPVP